MNEDETKLSRQSREVMAILRQEIASGRIPAEHAKFLANAVKLYESMGIVRTFIVQLAAFLVAIGVVWTWWPKK
jgi:hypothetical protein